MNRLFPFRTAEIDGFEFHYLRGDSPPQDPKEFSAQGLEFHDRIDDLSGDSAIDVGAHIGSYTLRLAKRFRNVRAFEPSPIHSKVLRLNVKLNNLHNVFVEEVALSDVNGVMPLYIRRGGATSLDPSHYGLRYDKMHFVTTVRLDDFHSKFARLDFVKIDAEGLEYRILNGGRKMISQFRPVMAIEVHQARVPSDECCECDTCSLLHSLGYNVEVTGEFSSVGDVHWVWATPKGETGATRAEYHHGSLSRS